MKILQVIPNLNAGGGERFTVDLCNELSREHEVHLITFYDTDGYDLLAGFLNDSVKLQTLHKKRGFDYKIIFRLYAQIKKIHPDVIHTHLRCINYLLPLIPLFKVIKIIHTIHSDAFRECENIYIRKIRNLFFKRGIIIPVTVSKESSIKYYEAYRNKKCYLIHNGRSYPDKSEKYNKTKSEIENYKLNNSTKVFINVARISDEKNQTMLIDAFSQYINDTQSDAILLIIGGGKNESLKNKIKDKIAFSSKRGVRIFYLNEKSNVTDYLYTSNFFCLTSLYEGMPISLIEALAVGCIPISTPAGGVSEIISELNKSFLSSDYTRDSYVKLLKKVTELNENEYNKYKYEAISMFRSEYTINKSVNKYINIYE